MILSASTLLVWFGVGWFLHAGLLHEVDEIYDGQLRQSGRILAGIIRTGGDEIELNELRAALPEAQFDGIPQDHSVVDRTIRQAGKYERLMGFQIVDRGGTLLFRSPGAPSIAFSSEPDVGVSDRIIGGIRWRVCGFRDDNRDRTVYIGEQYAVREEITKYLLLSMRAPVLLGLLVVGILIWLSVHWGLKPLSDLAHQVRDRDTDDFSGVEPGPVSIELRPIVDSLNALFARVRNTFDAERRFTGDAAHELRTPLAALKVQSQVAFRAQTHGERAKALNGVLSGVDRATHLVNQLLDLSRLDSQQRPELSNVIGITEVAEGVATDLAPLAREKGITVSGAGDGDTGVRADEALISMLVRNLLDNAIRYSEPGGQVEWSVTRHMRHILIEIRDTGPGIRAEERQAVFERFRRLPVGRDTGAGLGLSIVRRIADIYGAEISLRDNPRGRGLLVSVRFPLAAADSGAPADPRRSEQV